MSENNNIDDPNNPNSLENLKLRLKKLQDFRKGLTWSGDFDYDRKTEKMIKYCNLNIPILEEKIKELKK